MLTVKNTRRKGPRVPTVGELLFYLLSMIEDAKANKVSVFLKNTDQIFITETAPHLRCAERLGFISTWGSKVTLKLSCHN